MARKGKGSEPEASAVQRFSELLSSHLDRGTRPGGSPDAEGVRWTIKEFAAAVRADERSVRAWCGGKYLPKDLYAIEKQLFGDNGAYRGAVDKLRRLHREARSGVLSAEVTFDSTMSDVDARTESKRVAVPDKALFGRDTFELIEAEFREAIAHFIIGAGRVVLVPHPDTALLGFREMMNRLMAVEKADNQERVIIWTLDSGKQNFDDPESRMKFMNVESLASRFRALKRFREDAMETRWNWLHSRSIIALHDTRSVRPDVPRLPDFDPQHVLFSAIPPRWAGATNFHALYGHERLQETNYTVFLRKHTVESARGKTPSSNASHGDCDYELRYFGHALIESEETDRYQMRSLELISPGRTYVEALGTLFAAAVQRLGLQSFSTGLSIDGLKIDPEHAIEKLRHHGFILLRLNEFLAL